MTTPACKLTLADSVRPAVDRGSAPLTPVVPRPRTVIADLVPLTMFLTYELHVQLGLIAQGILQGIATMHKDWVWDASTAGCAR